MKQALNYSVLTRQFSDLVCSKAEVYAYRAGWRRNDCLFELLNLEKKKEEEKKECIAPKFWKSSDISVFPIPNYKLIIPAFIKP